MEGELERARVYRSRLPIDYCAKFSFRMQNFFVTTKQWITKAVQCIGDTLASAGDCFFDCRNNYLDRRQRRRHDLEIENAHDVKITFHDPSEPGILLNEFCRGRPRIGDSSNSTTTDETASDDSLLGSPNVDQRDRLASKQWVQQDHAENRSIDLSDHSTNGTLNSQISSSCTDQSGESDQLRKINAELLTQVHRGNERILELERQILDLQSGRQESTDSDTSNPNVQEIISDIECKTEAIPLNSHAPPPPPPAPPLPPSNWTLSAPNLSTKRRKSVPVASCSLKTLNWIKLNEDSLRASVWSELDDERLYDVLDLKEIDKHFACASNYDAFGTIRSRLSVCSIREISVLDARRAQNCAILLSKLKLSDHEIRDAVLTMDSADSIPKDLADQLLKFIPTKEEIDLLAPYVHSKDMLHPADRFFMEIASIKRYEQRLRCLCFKKLFAETLEETTKKISTVTTASRRVLHSKRLRRLLEIVLAVGNYLNQSKRSSDAYGFHLSVLIALQDVKSVQNNEYTLMHYLTEFCQRSMPDVLGLLQETAVCVEGAKISGADIQLDMDKLKDGLKLLEMEIGASEKTKGGESDSFSKVAAYLLKEYKEAYSNLDTGFKEMKAAFTACCKAYAPEERYQDKMNVSEFFGYFAQFLNQFTTVETQIVRKRREQEIRTLTLTRVKAKRQPLSGTLNGSIMSSRSRRSGRISKKAITDVNEDLLTSVLLSMDQRRNSGQSPVPNDIIICGSKYRRSFRLSAKRKQLKSPTVSSNGTVIRRKTSVQPKNDACNAESEPIILENCDVTGLEKHDRVRKSRRTRSRCSESLCRER